MAIVISVCLCRRKQRNDDSLFDEPLQFDKESGSTRPALADSTMGSSEMLAPTGVDRMSMRKMTNATFVKETHPDASYQQMMNMRDTETLALEENPLMRMEPIDRTASEQVSRARSDVSGGQDNEVFYNNFTPPHGTSGGGTRPGTAAYVNMNDEAYQQSNALQKMASLVSVTSTASRRSITGSAMHQVVSSSTMLELNDAYDSSRVGSVASGNTPFTSVRVPAASTTLAPPTLSPDRDSALYDVVVEHPKDVYSVPTEESGNNDNATYSVPPGESDSNNYATIHAGDANYLTLATKYPDEAPIYDDV